MKTRSARANASAASQVTSGSQFGERTIGLVLDDAIADVPRVVLLDLGEHAARHVDVEMAQDRTVVVQAVAERVFLVQVAVQEILVLDLHGAVDQLGRLADSHEEIAQRPRSDETTSDSPS